MILLAMMLDKFRMNSQRWINRNGLGVEREFLDDNMIPCFDDIVDKAVMQEVQVALPPSIQHDDGKGNGP